MTYDSYTPPQAEGTTLQALRNYLAANAPEFKVEVINDLDRRVISISRVFDVEKTGISLQAMQRHSAHTAFPKFRDIIGISIYLPNDASRVAGYRYSHGYAWSHSQWGKLDRSEFDQMLGDLREQENSLTKANERELAKAREHPINVNYREEQNRRRKLTRHRAETGTTNDQVDAYIFEKTGRSPIAWRTYSSSTRRTLRQQAREAMQGGPPMKWVGDKAPRHE